MDVITARRERVPIYFGSAESALFGCYHPPSTGTARDCAVVLCHPFGQEYIRAHRSFLQLAKRLTGRGFPVLRFDFFACGDSAGETEEGRVERWADDVGTAIEEARSRSGRERICLVGLRLGAALAATAAAARGDVDSLVLWDPVVRGVDYLAELESLQAELLRFEYVNPPEGQTGVAEEALGFPLTPELRRGLRGIDLLSLGRAPARRVLVVESGRPAGVEQLAGRLARTVPHFEHRHLPERKVWLAEPFRGIVPHPLIEAVVAWTAQVHS